MKPTTSKISSTTDKLSHDQLQAKLQRALNRGGRNYEIRALGNRKFHIKSGHLPLNILFGMCGQCYKFDVDFGNANSIRVKSTVPCGGAWGGMIGCAMEQAQRDEVKKLLINEFPGLEVTVS